MLVYTRNMIKRNIHSFVDLADHKIYKFNELIWTIGISTEKNIDPQKYNSGSINVEIDEMKYYLLKTIPKTTTFVFVHRRN
jgi:hypothetical protein